MRVYVTGPLKGLNKSATNKNRHNLSLVCRKVLLVGMTPVCPILASEDWELDPRLPTSDGWWIENYLFEFIRDCDEFVHVAEPIGTKSSRLEMEKNIWRTLGNNRLIPSDIVFKSLLGAKNEEERA